MRGSEEAAVRNDPRSRSGPAGSAGLLNATLANALVQVWQYASAFGSGIITARWLGLDDKGAYRLITMVPTIVFMFSELGLGAATVYFLGKKRFRIEAVFGHLLMACPVAGGLGFGGFLLLLPFLEATVLAGVPHESLIAVGLSVPLTLLAFLLGHLLLATGQFRQYNLGLSIAASVKLVGLIVLIVVADGGLFAATLAWILGEAGHVAYVLWRSVRVVRPRFAIQPELVKSFLRYGVQVQLVGVFLLGNLQIDTLLLSYFAGPDKSPVGLYAVSMSVSLLLLFIPTAASVILSPQLSSSSGESAAELTCRSVRLALSVGLLFAVGLAAISPWLIPFAFGRPFIGSVPALMILLPGAIFCGGGKILSSFLNMQGKPSLNVIAGLVALTVNSGLTFWLVPKIGNLGAAVGSATAYLVLFLILLSSFRLLTGRRLREIVLLRRVDWESIRVRWTGRGE